MVKQIVNEAINKKIDVISSSDFKMTTGKGIMAVVAGRKMLCGNERFLTENGIAVNKEISDTTAGFRNEGKATILVAEENVCIGIIALTDMLRPEAEMVIKQLTEMGTKTVLLTGDNKRTADYFSSKAGISEVYAELLPVKKSKAYRNCSLIKEKCA